MSLSSLGGVLVDTPSDLSVQSLLATHSNLLSQTSFLPSPTTEITLDEDDVFQCGRCKEVFTSFHQFMLHKQNHQIASSSSRILNESLALNISRDLNRTSSSEHEAGTCVSSNRLLKDSSCEEFDLPESLRVNGQNSSNNVLSYNSTFDDLSDDIGQPLLLSGADGLNFPIEQSMLNLTNENELSSGSYAQTSIPHLQASLLPHKLLSDENCASNNNVWLPSQKDDSSNTNFITSGFADEQDFFGDTKKVSDSNISFSNHSLLTEISYPGEKQMYLNDASNPEEIAMSGNLSAAVLPSEQLLLETSKDYFRSCELLEEFESTNQHGLLDSTSLESTNVMGIGLPLLSNSSVVSSLVDSSTPSSNVSPLVPLSSQQRDQSCHSFENVLQGDCKALGSSLSMECSTQGHKVGGMCQNLDDCISFNAECDSSQKIGSVVTEKKCQKQKQAAEVKEPISKVKNEVDSNEKFNTVFTGQDRHNCDDAKVDCNFNSNNSFNNRNKVSSVNKAQTKLNASENAQESHFKGCTVASIMKEIGILDMIEKNPHNENSNAVEEEQNQNSTISGGNNNSMRPQNIWKSGDSSNDCNDGLWPSTVDHDYQLVQKNALSNGIQEDTVNDSSGISIHDSEITDEVQCEINHNSLSRYTVKQDNCSESHYLSEVKISENENSFECDKNLSKPVTQSFDTQNKFCDGGSNTGQCEPTLSDCEASNSCNSFNERNYGNSDAMPVELFNDVSHTSNIMVELDCDSNQSNIIFIDHGNFVGEQEIILSGRHGEVNSVCTNSTRHEGFSSPEDSQLSVSKRNVPKQNGDNVIFLSNPNANGSVERVSTVGKDEQFGSLCLPSADLYDCVSVVYSAYEEESTTFSKLWNPDIKLSSELFQVETDSNDAAEQGVQGPQPRSPSKKRKGSKSLNRSKVEKLQKAALSSQQKLLHEVPSLPSSKMKQTMLKPTELPISEKSLQDVCDDSVESNIPHGLFTNKNKAVTLSKTIEVRNKDSQLSLSTTIALNQKKNSSVISYGTDSAVNPVKPANPMPSKNTKVRENLWEKRTPKLSCDHCDKKFAKFFDLRQHMRCHTGEKPFQCVVCGRSFTQKSNLTKHLSTHKIWSKSVSTLPKNAIQKVCHKKKGGTVTKTESVICEKGEAEKNVCDSITQEEEFQSSPHAMQDDNDGWEIISEECIVDNSYICQFCGASFVTYFELKTHRKTHRDEKVFFCPRNNCQKTFPDLESFVLHVNEHAPEETFHPCNICGETFTSASEVTRHMEVHTSTEKSAAKKYHAKCDKCKSTFLSQEALENHLRTVSHDLPCPECKRIFSCESRLRRHLRTHSTLHPFACKECGKRFKTALYLNTHLAMHRDDKPFACSQCPAKFARKDRLSRHLKIHSEGECCPFQAHLKCNRQFNRPDKLKAHVLSHTEHQSINCTFCRRQIAIFSVNKRNHASSNQQFEDSSNDALDPSGMGISCDISSAEISSNLGIDSESNASLNFNGSITLGMLQDKQSVDIDNLSCENFETNSLNFDHIVYKNPANSKEGPTIGIIVMPLS